MNSFIISNINFINEKKGGEEYARSNWRKTFSFGKLHLAHLAQNADLHNLVQLNFLFSVSELGFLDEHKLIETLEEFESFGMILVQLGNSNSELVVVTLMPDFTEILREREAKGRRKMRVRHSATYDLKYTQSSVLPEHNQFEKPSGDTGISQPLSNFGKAVNESPGNMQSELFPSAEGEFQGQTIRRKSNRKQPRSRYTLQDCWNFAQYQRQINGAEKIPTPDRFAVALYTTGQQDDEIDLFLLSREQYQQPHNADQNVVH